MSPNWVVITGDFKTIGGQDKANWALATFLAARGDSVELVAHRVDEPLASTANVRTTIVQRPLGSYFLGQPFLAAAGERAIRKALERDSATRIVVNGGNCLGTDVNWVHMVHAAAPRVTNGASLPWRLKEAWGHHQALKKEREILPRSRIVIANSDRTERDLVQRLNIPADRVRRVWLGADSASEPTRDERAAARRWLGVSGNDAVVAFVGILTRMKGFDTLIKAWRQVVMESPEAVLVAAGAGRVAEWQRRIDDAGLKESVQLLGPISEVPELLAASDLLVSPTRYDGYGLNVQEAVCRGVPAVVSRCAGVAERYPPELASLLLDDPENADALAQRILAALWALSELRVATVRFGAALRTWTWRDMAAAIVTEIEVGPRVASSSTFESA